MIKLYVGDNLKRTNTQISSNIGKIAKNPKEFSDFSMLQLIYMFSYNN